MSVLIEVMWLVWKGDRESREMFAKDSAVFEGDQKACRFRCRGCVTVGKRKVEWQ